MQLELAAFAATPLASHPYPHVIVPGFLNALSLAEVGVDFPKLEMAGLFPPRALSYGPAFARLLELFAGDELRQAVAEKFDIDLAGRPTFTSVRCRARARDGQIHRDADFKLVTLLLYLNDQWAEDGGRLRVLRSPDDIEDYAAEVPPDGGVLFAFRCTDTAWHGHKPFAGRRRCIQMNYVTDETMRAREEARHQFSARMKKLKRVFGLG